MYTVEYNGKIRTFDSKNHAEDFAHKQLSFRMYHYSKLVGWKK